VQVSKVRVHMKDARFNFESLLGISRAGAGLFKWVAAMVNYYAVAKTVEPKRKKVSEAEKSLRAASKDLIATQEAVARLSGELEALNKSFSEKSAEQQDLREKAEVMERRLAAASKLIDGLSSERERWTRDMQSLDERQARVSAACLLGPLCICAHAFCQPCYWRHHAAFGCNTCLLPR
jgi:dynein heavy chain, axonemal